MPALADPIDPATTSIDLAVLKARQQAAWSSGDYSVIGTTLQIVGEDLCEALDVCSGQRVLDVAAGSGNASLAAARRWCEVTSIDYVAALLERARERAQAERLAMTFREADAEALPFPDESFDVVLSTFGVMFTPDQERAAKELVRVCNRGGKIGLASWTPRASSARSSRPSVAICRPPERSRQPGGERAPASPISLSRLSSRSTRRSATSPSATARPSTGSRSSGLSTGQC